jgi:hypothetical protein
MRRCSTGTQIVEQTYFILAQILVLLSLEGSVIESDLSARRKLRPKGKTKDDL